jgi:hypothetical protein
LKSLANLWREKRKKFSTLKWSYIEQIQSQFHILDSLPSDPPRREEKQLQLILLQYFKDESYEEGRIAVNVAKVINNSSQKF